MKAALSVLVACLLLAACDGAPSGDANMIPSGGAAGHKGSAFCQTVPADANDRWQWNELCFPNSH